MHHMHFYWLRFTIRNYVREIMYKYTIYIYYAYGACNLFNLFKYSIPFIIKYAMQ